MKTTHTGDGTSSTWPVSASTTAASSTPRPGRRDEPHRRHLDVVLRLLVVDFVEDEVRCCRSARGTARRLRREPQCRERLEPRHRNPLPHLARAKFTEHRRGPADMIGIAVRQRGVGEPSKARVADHGRDDAVADVEG